MRRENFLGLPHEHIRLLPVSLTNSKLEKPLLFQYSADKNIGDTRVLQGESCRGHHCGHNITTILLDDLLEVITFKRAVMKMDIQGYEHKAFQRAEKLLNNVKISHIFIEWVLMTDYAKQGTKDKTMVLTMIEMLQRKGFKPYTIDGKLLNSTAWNKWPYDMVWSNGTPF